MNISVVIVNWNSGDQLRACLSSIEQYGTDCVNEIIVYDNCSSDNSLDGAIDFNRVKIINSISNDGFAKGCNAAAKLATSQYLLFLNPDACLLPNTIPNLYEAINKESANSKRVGVHGIKLIDENGLTHKHCTRLPTVRAYFGHVTGLSKIFKKSLRYIFMSEFDHESTREVDHTIGAFYLIEKGLFDTLGGFDERFFVYLEDLDLSLRVKEAGYRILYVSDAVAFHKGGGVSEQVKAARLFYSLRSRILFCFKNMKLMQAVSVLLLTCLVEPLTRLGKALISLSFSDFINTLKAYWMLYMFLFSLCFPTKKGKDR